MEKKENLMIIYDVILTEITYGISTHAICRRKLLHLPAPTHTNILCCVSCLVYAKALWFMLYFCIEWKNKGIQNTYGKGISRRCHICFLNKAQKSHTNGFYFHVIHRIHITILTLPSIMTPAFILDNISIYISHIHSRFSSSKYHYHAIFTLINLRDLSIRRSQLLIIF